MSSFFTEVKRRNVLRAGALYAAGAWLLVQVATQVFPFFHIAEWVVRWIVVAATIGFPFTLVFSWFYEWTPRGFQLESEVPPNDSTTRSTGRKLDRWIIAVLSLAVVLLLANTFILHRDESSVGGKLAGSDKSIAVLPFINMSSDKEQDYFSDGLSEELLNQLAQIPQLRVIARTSSFSFKGKEVDVATIAKALNVANVLEGSVRKSANTLRITAQLVRTSDSSHLWSQTYDREMSDV
jgi:TolB-like protein